MWWSRRKVRLERFYSWPAEPRRERKPEPVAQIEATEPASVAQEAQGEVRGTIPAPTLPQPPTGLLRAEKRISDTLRTIEAVTTAQELRAAIRANRKARADYAAMMAAWIDEEEAILLLLAA